ncbi:MAG: zf-HC2 domain-containing protein [Yoonia sp.]|nr:zf-HC2 domain-containing protein [Yoonia sp.]
MLNCRDLAYQADAFLDGELSLWKKLQIRIHMSMCNGCSAFIDQMRSTRTLVKAEAQVADTADTEIDSILAVLHTKNQPGS